MLERREKPEFDISWVELIIMVLVADLFVIGAML